MIGGPEQPVTRVEGHHAEALLGVRAVPRQQVAGDLCGVQELLAQRRFPHQRPAAQFDARENARRHDGTDAGHTEELPPIDAGQSLHGPDDVEERVGQVEGVLAGATVADEQRDQLVVAERGRS